MMTMKTVVVVVDKGARSRARRYETVGAPTNPISSSKSSRNRLPLNTGNGTMVDKSSVWIVSARELYGTSLAEVSE